MGFTLQAFGPFLHWMTLGVLASAPILLAFLLYKLGGLPGSIARTRAPAGRSHRSVRLDGRHYHRPVADRDGMGLSHAG